MPFTKQDIKELEGISETAGSCVADYNDYKKEGYYVRSITGLRAWDWTYLEQLAHCVKTNTRVDDGDGNTVLFTMVWYKYRDKIKAQDEIMKKCYRELSVSVNRYAAGYWYPVLRLYYLYPYERYCTLFDVKLNALSIQILIMTSLSW